MRRFAVALLVWFLIQPVAPAQVAGEPNQPSSSCRIEAVNYKGWRAQQLSNRWVTLEVVPQNGGRLMQVIFAGHPFLFVNPKYEGKYLPPDPPNGLTMAATSSGSYPREMTTNNIG